MVKAIWEGNRGVFFNNRIVDADTPSYVSANLSCESVATRAASAKKTKYRLAAKELRVSFIPLVCFTKGVLLRKYAAFQKWLAYCLVSKWPKPFSTVMACIHIHMQFVIFRSVNL